MKGFSTQFLVIGDTILEEKQMSRSFLEVLFPFLVKTFFAEFNVFATCIQLLNY